MRYSLWISIDGKIRGGEMKRKKAISFGLISTDLDKLMDRANKVVRKKKRLRVDQCYKAVIKNNDGEVIWQKRI